MEIDPENAKAWYYIGNAHYKLNQYWKAIDCYQEAVEFAPEFADAWYNMGEAYFEINEYIKAIECYQKTLEIDPKYEKLIDSTNGVMDLALVT